MTNYIYSTYTIGMKDVVIYTDGCCLKNPGGKGGYGAVLIYRGHRREIKQGYRSTTSNRMELMGVIAALGLLKEPCNVTVYSDSQYVIKTMHGRFGEGANHDLWDKLREVSKGHYVQYVWLRGHNGDAHNERADRLAGMSTNGELLEDSGYVRLQ